jgi:hypothetical protein
LLATINNINYGDGMTQTPTFRVTAKDRLSDSWVTREFSSLLEANAWASERAFIRPCSTGRTVLEVDASDR